MEPELSAGIESKKASVYGRDYAQDLDSYFNDVSLQKIFALFGHYEFIQNAKHLSDIAGITEMEAIDRLECLKNLSLLGVNEQGYFRKKDYIKQEILSSKKDRVKRHSVRLMQIASLYPEASHFCDDFMTFSTSEQLCHEFYNKLAEARKEFVAKSKELKASEQKKILTFGLGFIMDDVGSDGSANND